MEQRKMEKCICIMFVYYTNLSCVKTFEVEFTISTSNSCYWTPCDTTGLSRVACASVCMENMTCKGMFYSQKDGMCCECSYSVPGQPNYSGAFIRKTKANACSESLIDGIPDQSLTASTVYDYMHVPTRARMAATYIPGMYNGAWVAANWDTDKYIQAQFSAIKEVMKIVTKGKDVFNQHVTSYKVSYSVDCSTFAFVTNANNEPKNKHYTIKTFGGVPDACIESVLYTVISSPDAFFNVMLGVLPLYVNEKLHVDLVSRL